MSMSDSRELEWAKKPDAFKEGWKARVETHTQNKNWSRLIFCSFLQTQSGLLRSWELMD